METERECGNCGTIWSLEIMGQDTGKSPYLISEIKKCPMCRRGDDDA